MTSKTTKMSIDIPLKDPKKIKVHAAVEGVTLSEFVIECIHKKIYLKKLPNKKSIKSMEDARKEKTTKAKNLNEILNQLRI